MKILVIAAFSALHIYLYRVIVRRFAPPRWGRIVLITAFVFLIAAFFVGRYAAVEWGREAALWLIWPGSLWTGWFTMAVPLLVAVDVVLGLPLTHLERRGRLTMVGRGRVVKKATIAVMAFATLVSGFGIHEAFSGPDVVEIEAKIDGLPARLDGTTVVQVTDLHMGAVVGPEYRKKTITMVSALHPDILVLTGDISDEIPARMAETFALFARITAPKGTFGITGNHEYYVGGQYGAAKVMSDVGIRVLRQERVVIDDGLVIAGVDDQKFLGSSGFVDQAIDTAVSGGSSDLPVLLLAHRPDGFEHAADLGVDVMLCGHTHGGQVFPFHIITWLQFGVVGGRYDVDDMLLYVNRGAGFWGPPMRVGARGEILKLTLRGGD